MIFDVDSFLKDLVENIQPGVAQVGPLCSLGGATECPQRMGENTLAILIYLSSEESPLPSLTTGYTRPTTAFFTEVGNFVQYQFATARVMYCTLFCLSLAVAWSVYRERVPGSEPVGFWNAQWNGARTLLVTFAGALAGANGLAVIMHRVFGRNMSWFSSEHSALLLYGPAALAGLFFVYLLNPVLSELARHARITNRSP
jgi:hypothetical protein